MELKPGTYEHYKGKIVRVIGVGKHSETLEEMAIYEELSGEGSKLWVRPLSMFLGEVSVDGKSMPRSAFIETADEQ